MTKTYAAASVVCNGAIVRNTMVGPVAASEPSGDTQHMPIPSVVGYYL